MIDEKALAEYEALCTALPAGTYYREEYDDGDEHGPSGYTYVSNDVVRQASDDDGDVASCDSAAIADWLVASRTMGPALCAALRAERATVERLREALQYRVSLVCGDELANSFVERLIAGGGPVQQEASQRFYLLSLSRSTQPHAAMTFWAPDARGYTGSLSEAGKFTDREVAKYASRDSLAIPCGAVQAVVMNDMVSHRHIDSLKAVALITVST